MRRLYLVLVAVLVVVMLAACAGGRGGGQGGAVELDAMQTPAGKTYDLIPLIDPALDRQHGDWTVQANGELRCDTGGFVPRIHVPYRPPQEYDFTVVFSQRDLRNGISLIMPKQGGQFFWYLGGGPGRDYGFASNPNKGGSYVELIKPNVKYQTTVQVRRGEVKGCLNGRVLISYKTNLGDLISDGWRDMKDKTVLAVACDDPTTFHAVQITEVTGQGTRVR
jgi:hypothetical protein